MTKVAELRSKATSELKALLGELRRKQFKLRLIKSSGELTKTHEVRETRREIAQIQTILSEQEGKRNG